MARPFGIFFPSFPALLFGIECIGENRENVLQKQLRRRQKKVNKRNRNSKKLAFDVINVDFFKLLAFFK